MTGIFLPAISAGWTTVVERSGSDALVSADELRAFLRSKLSAHKIPRIVEFCDSPPRSPTGKVLR